MFDVDVDLEIDLADLEAFQFAASAMRLSKVTLGALLHGLDLMKKARNV